MIHTRRGRYTDKEIDRCAKMCGGFGKDIQNVYEAAVYGVNPNKSQYHHRSGGEAFKQQVQKFIEAYKSEDLMKYHPNRNPKGLPVPIDKSKLKNPFMLGAYLKSRSSKLDKFIRFSNETGRRQQQTN